LLITIALYRGLAAEHAMLGLCGDSSAADDMPSNATALQNLTSYRWVGNVCELQSVIEGAVVLANGSVAEIDAEAEQATTEQIARSAGERGAKLHSSRSERDSLGHPRQQGNA
jgi:DNA-binding NtrC family response regulator